MRQGGKEARGKETSRSWIGQKDEELRVRVPHLPTRREHIPNGISVDHVKSRSQRNGMMRDLMSAGCSLWYPFEGSRAGVLA